MKRLKLSNTHRPLDVILYWRKNEELELNAPYQRGEVWGLKRRRNLIKSIVQRIPIPSIIVNDRFGAGWCDKLSAVVVDGKQRITAVLKFVDGEYSVPGEYFDMEGEVFFSDLPENKQRRFRQTALPFCEGQVESLEDEQELFNLVNYGGLPQGEKDVDI